MNSEILEGYAVDIACLRKYPRAELVERARAHTQGCVRSQSSRPCGAALRTLAEKCPGDDQPECPILDGLVVRTVLHRAGGAGQ